MLSVEAVHARFHPAGTRGRRQVRGGGGRDPVGSQGHHELWTVAQRLAAPQLDVVVPGGGDGQIELALAGHDRTDREAEPVVVLEGAHRSHDRRRRRGGVRVGDGGLAPRGVGDLTDADGAVAVAVGVQAEHRPADRAAEVRHVEPEVGRHEGLGSGVDAVLRAEIRVRLVRTNVGVGHRGERRGVGGGLGPGQHDDHDEEARQQHDEPACGRRGLEERVRAGVHRADPLLRLGLLSAYRPFRKALEPRLARGVERGPTAEG